MTLMTHREAVQRPCPGKEAGGRGQPPAPMATSNPSPHGGGLAGAGQPEGGPARSGNLLPGIPSWGLACCVLGARTSGFSQLANNTILRDLLMIRPLPTGFRLWPPPAGGWRAAHGHLPAGVPVRRWEGRKSGGMGSRRLGAAWWPAAWKEWGVGSRAGCGCRGVVAGAARPEATAPVRAPGWPATVADNGRSGVFGWGGQYPAAVGTAGGRRNHPAGTEDMRCCAKSTPEWPRTRCSGGAAIIYQPGTQNAPERRLCAARGIPGRNEWRGGEKRVASLRPLVSRYSTLFLRLAFPALYPRGLGSTQRGGGKSE